MSKLIEWQGDSTTLGTPPGVEFPATSYIDLLGYKAVNRGVGGQTTSILLALPWLDHVQASTAEIEVISLCINDVYGTLDLYEENLHLIVKQARMNGKTVLFETPNPTMQPTLGTYVQKMRDVATELNIPVIDQFAYLTGVIGSEPLSNFLVDSDHPNALTHRLKGQYANSRLNEILNGAAATVQEVDSYSSANATNPPAMYEHVVTAQEITDGIANVTTNAIALDKVHGITVVMDTGDGAHIVPLGNASYFSGVSHYTTSPTNVQIALGASAAAGMVIRVTIIEAI